MTQSMPHSVREYSPTPEFRLVVACSWFPVSAHTARQANIIESLSKCDLNWDEVTALVIRHGVIGQFCTVMGKRGWINFPTETKERLKNFRTQQAVKALGQAAELARVGELFAKAGIPLIPLKGVALSQELYCDPCVRTSVDLDILIQPKHIEKAEEILFNAGYHHALGFHDMTERQKRYITRTLPHYQYTNSARNIHIELHWRSYLWSQEQMIAIWEAGRTSTWLNVDFRQLSTEDNILFLADHGARHGWQCIKWLSDIAMLMQCLTEVEWLSLYKRAAFFDLQRVVCQAALLVETIYGIQLPEKFKSIYTNDKTIQSLSVYSISQLLAPANEVAFKKKFAELRKVLLIKRLKPSTPVSALLSCIMITPADFFEIPLPDFLFWFYLPLRPYFWFKRHYMKR